MRTSRSGLIGLTLLLLATSVWAEPLQVRSGYVEWDYADPWVFALRATGFEARGMSSSAMTGPLFDDPRSRCPDVRPCTPGARLPLGAHYEGAALGQGDVGGVSVPVYFGGSFDFDAGTGRVLALGAIQAPFTFTGSLIGYDNAARSGEPLFTRALTGQGTATVYFQDTPTSGATGPSTWLLLYAFEDTAPVPEPSTLMLLGTAIAGAALRWRRRA